MESDKLVELLKMQRNKLLSDRDKLASMIADFESETLTGLVHAAIEAVENVRKYQQLLIDQMIDDRR